MIEKKLPFYFSIDFEDFYYDSLRALGKQNPGSKANDLYHSYEKIKKIQKKYLNNKPITFFVTGILAKKMPDLISKIYKDGNEISCHYNFHDNINKCTRSELAKNLDIAIDNIYKITGEKPVGFRAPNFAINDNDLWAYEEISKRFKYDSSYKTSKKFEELDINNLISIKGGNFKEYYVFCMPIINNLFKIKSGGTYLRLFPINLILKCLWKTYKMGHTPLIYLHPYEITLNKNFWIKWNELSFLPLYKRVYWWLRQNQWARFGQHQIENKLDKICRHFEHRGPMRDLLLNSN